MKLSELIDLEVQFLRDEQALADEVAGQPEAAGRAAAMQRRDRAIGHQVAAAHGLEEADAAERLAVDRRLRHKVCQQWLAHLPKAARLALPGARIERGYRLAGWLLFALFCMLGAGAATAALATSGGRPVNVLVFVAVFFVLQILLLLLLPILMLVRRVRGGGVLPWLQGAIVRIARMRWIDKLCGSGGEDLAHTLDQLRLRQTIYGGVQRWLLFSTVQRMAIGFNAAGLLASLYAVTVQDLPFGWSTTLDVAPATLERAVRTVALPWSFVGPEATPTLQAIECSRFGPGTASYLPLPAGVDVATAVQLRRSWWPFLVAGLVTWGLLPRLLAYALGAYQMARHTRRLPLNHTAAQHLYDRMFPPVIDWRGPAPDAVRGARPRADRLVQPRPLAKTAAGPSCAVCWGTLYDDAARVRTHLEERFGHRIDDAVAAGQADPAGDAASLARLRRMRAARVIVALPEGQQPTKDLMRFLRAVREIGTELELVVGLLARVGDGFRDVDRQEREVWRERLLAEADPYLSLQTMGGAS